MVSDWLKQQRKLRIDGVRAVLFDGSPGQILERSPHDWIPEEVTLIRTLLRPPQKQLLVAMDLRGLAEELGSPELGSYEAAKLRAWLDPLPRHLQPRKVFSVNFEIDGGPGLSQVWGWQAVRLGCRGTMICFASSARSTTTQS